MQRQSHNALLVFSHTPQIVRENMSEPYAALPWEDVDTLFTALVGDVVKSAFQIEGTDILLYRNEEDISDDYFLPFRKKMQLHSLTDGLMAEQIQHAIDAAFAANYSRVAVLLDNLPFLTPEFFQKVFDQLHYEDDCFVVGPTVDGRCFLLGMKVNHSGIFDPSNGDPLTKPHLLMSRLCQFDNVLFLTPPSYSLDSSSNLRRLKSEVDMLNTSDQYFPAKTHEIFKLFDKKYKVKKTAR